MSKRATCLAAWRGTQQMAVASGAMTMTAPAFVGYALAKSDGDVETARLFAPEGPQSFRERVLATLGEIVDEEETPLRAAGGAGK